MILHRRGLWRKYVYPSVCVALILAVLLFWEEATGVPRWHASMIGLDAGSRETIVPPSGTVRVTRVIDGDTFEIEGGERVRLIGIDAPESVKPNAPIECFGKESSEYLRVFIEGKDVRLERDRTERDRYARLLRYVYMDEVFVNEKIVREGYAESVGYRPDIRLQARLHEAERQAKAGHIGRWAEGICP